MKHKFYLVLISAITFAQYGLCSIQHTDLTPDSIFTGFQSFFLDFNNDGEDDLSIWLFQIPGNNAAQIQTINGQVLGDTTTTVPEAYALDSGDAVNSYLPDSDWIDSDGGFIYLALESGSHGQWTGTQNKYLGVRFFIDGRCHYGWVQMDINNGIDTMVIKAHAYETEPGKGLHAGQENSIPSQETNAVINLELSDIDDNGDASDIRVTFDVPTIEFQIDEYRLYLIPLDSVTGFNKCQAHGSSHYYSFSPNGQNKDTVLPNLLNVYDGQVIQNYVQYQSIVLSVPNGVDAIVGTLSSFSDTLMLEIKAGKTNNLQVSLDTVGQSFTLNYSFDKASDESKISEYRLFIIPVSDTNQFTLDSANQTSSMGYKSITPTGSDLIGLADSSCHDIHGQALVHSVDYTIVILSVADGSNATLNNLSLFSSPVTIPLLTNIQSNESAHENVFVNSGRAYIRVGNMQSFELVIRNLVGSVVFRYSGFGPENIILPRLNPGAYVLHVDLGKKVLKKKFCYLIDK